MLNQFSRTQLLLGPEAMEHLVQCRVAVFGVGGVGGYTVEALARSGVGALDLIDDDKVCLTNLNRQIFATRSTVGRYKVDVAEERIKDPAESGALLFWNRCRASFGLRRGAYSARQPCAGSVRRFGTDGNRSFEPWSCKSRFHRAASS